MKSFLSSRLSLSVLFVAIFVAAMVLVTIGAVRQWRELTAHAPPEFLEGRWYPEGHALDGSAENIVFVDESAYVRKEFRGGDRTRARGLYIYDEPGKTIILRPQLFGGDPSRSGGREERRFKIVGDSLVSPSGVRYVNSRVATK